MPEDELVPVPNVEKLNVLWDLCLNWVEDGILTHDEAIDFYTEMAQILTSEENDEPKAT